MTGLGRAASGSADIGLCVGASLTYENAAALCRAVRSTLAEGHDPIVMDLGEVRRVDIVGIAVLFQAVERIRERGARYLIRPSPALHRALFEAELLDILSVAASSVPGANALRSPAPDRGGPTADLARSARVALRWPRWEDLELFERWAKEPVLDHLVGSELLYRCRHLGAYHPEFIDSLLNDPSSLTVLVEPLAATRAPVGFVRFFKINLAQGFAFIESTIADSSAVRRGLGVEATRLLSFYAQDVLRLRRLEAKVYAYNVLSVNALRRNGFQQEGVLRRARTWGSRTWDILVFAILDEEIREQRRKGDWPAMGLWE